MRPPVGSKIARKTTNKASAQSGENVEGGLAIFDVLSVLFGKWLSSMNIETPQIAVVGVLRSFMHGFDRPLPFQFSS